MRLMRAFPIVAAAIMSFAGASPVSAALVVGSSNILKEWNLITFGDLNGGQDTEGRAFVGGNMTGGYNTNIKGTTGLSSNGNAGLMVAGNLNTGNSGTVEKGAGIWVGGNVTGRIDRNGGGDFIVGGTSVQQNGSAPQTGVTSMTTALNQQKTEIINSLTSLSTNLKALSTTGTVSGAGTNQMTLTANDAFNVFNLNMSDLDDYASLNIVTASGKTTIINVSGTGTFATNFGGNDAYKDLIGSNVLWNFYEATEVNLNTTIFGSILAPLAKVTNTTAIEGSVYAASMQKGGEVHLTGFQGDLSSVGNGSPISAAPEPSTWAMLILGFGLVGAAMRRRQRNGFRPATLQAV